MSITVGIWKPNPAVVEAALDDEMVLLHVESGLYFGLDGLGTLIWSMLSDGADVEAIVDRIIADYDVTRDQVEADVHDFLTIMEDKGLLDGPQA